MLSNLHKIISSIIGDASYLSKKYNLNDHYGISEILPYRTFDEENNIYHNESSYGFILESTPLVGASEQTVKLLTDMVTDGLEKNFTLQFINWASPSVKHIFDKWAENRIALGGIYQKMAEKRVESFKNASWESYSKQLPIYTRDFRLFIAVSVPTSNDKSLITKLISIRKRLITTLKTIGIHSNNLNPDEFLSLLDELVNPTATSNALREKKWNKFDLLNRQVGNSEVKLSLKPSGLSFNNNGEEIEAKCFSVRNFPEVWAQWEVSDLIGDFMSDFLRMPCPFLTSFSFTVPDENNENQRANFKAARSTQQAGTELSRYMPDIRKKERDWKFVVEKLKLGQKLVKSFYQVIVYAPKDKIEEAEQSIRSIYKSNGWMLSSERYMHFQSWLCCLPFTQSEGLWKDLNRLGRMQTMVSWTCANVAPLQGEWKGLESPCMLLFARRGQPFFWSPFDGKGGNYNVKVVGKPGSGKSVFMQELVASLVASGAKVIIIDDGRSFMKTCQLLGGQFAEFSQNSGLCINPFDLIVKESFDNDAEYRKEVVSLTKKIIARMCRPNEKTSSIENSFIEQAFWEVWNAYGKKGTITKVSQFLKTQSDERARDIGEMLFPFTKDGMYREYFEGDATINLNNPFMVFELELIKSHKELLNIVMMMLMFAATEAMYKGQRKHKICLLMDESHQSLNDEDGEFSFEIVRRTRKYKCSLVTGTQLVGDYFANAGAKAVWENSEWAVLLSQLDESIESIVEEKRLILDESAIDALKSVKMVDHEYSEVFIKGSQGYAVGRLILDPFSISLFSSKAEDTARVNDLIDKGYNLEDAVEIASSYIRVAA